jgi:uncharacterized membrane protein
MTKKRSDRRPVRRMGAQRRQAERLSRSVEDQLAVVEQRKGESARERDKLTVLATAMKPAKPGRQS